MINWISVSLRVPEDRRKVLAWGSSTQSRMFNKPGQFLGVTRYNPSPRGGDFDSNKKFMYLSNTRVTHWAEINGPDE